MGMHRKERPEFGKLSGIVFAMGVCKECKEDVGNDYFRIRESV
jgi:hypothetical protein